MVVCCAITSHHILGGRQDGCGGIAWFTGIIFEIRLVSGTLRRQR